jgi:hypothetical protein
MLEDMKRYIWSRLMQTKRSSFLAELQENYHPSITEIAHSLEADFTINIEDIQQINDI